MASSCWASSVARRRSSVSARLLADERNQKWLPQVQAMLATDQNHLVIVGALHLLGDSGLVSLLQKQGLAVERVQAID